MRGFAAQFSQIALRFILATLACVGWASVFLLAHHWGRCGFRSAWADDEAVCPPYRAVGAERVAGVRRPILPDCASLHPCYAGLRRVGKRPFDKLRTGFLLAHHWGGCGFRSAWADDEAVCPAYRATGLRETSTKAFFNEPRSGASLCIAPDVQMPGNRKDIARPT